MTEIEAYVKTAKEIEMNVFDFKKVKVAPHLTKDWILSRVTDVQIAFHYVGRFSIGKAIRSPFRQDKTPSATFFIGESGDLVFWDFTEGRGLNVFELVKRIYNINFDRALQQIAADFGLIDATTSKCSPKLMEIAAEIDKDVKRETLIQFTVKPWGKGIGKPLSFWNLYEISKNELERDNVYNVDRLFLNKVEIKNPQNYPRFAKCESWGDGKQGVKIYSPTDPAMKWLSSIPLDVPFGLNNLSTTSNVVIVTKSFKDRLVLLKLFDSVIATQNESFSALPDDVIAKLDVMFDKKIIIFDNDEVGVTNSKKFNEKGFGYFNIPNKERERHGVKDPADYVKLFGIEALSDLFVYKNLL